MNILKAVVLLVSLVQLSVCEASSSDRENLLARFESASRPQVALPAGTRILNCNFFQSKWRSKPSGFQSTKLAIVSNGSGDITNIGTIAERNGSESIFWEGATQRGTEVETPMFNGTSFALEKIRLRQEDSALIALYSGMRGKVVLVQECIIE